MNNCQGRHYLILLLAGLLAAGCRSGSPEPGIPAQQPLPPYPTAHGPHVNGPPISGPQLNGTNGPQSHGFPVVNAPNAHAPVTPVGAADPTAPNRNSHFPAAGLGPTAGAGMPAVQPVTTNPGLSSWVDVRPVSQQTDEQGAGTFPPPARPGQDPTIPGFQPESIASPQGTPAPNPNALPLEAVVASVEQSYPLLLSVMLQAEVAEGKQMSAWGEFDLNVKAFGIAAPRGFYKTYRNGIGLNQPLYKGGYVYGGYKIGDGNFQPWFGERETNEGGEFSMGFGVPLLKDRQIDKRRAAVMQADIARQAVEPLVRTQLLVFSREAAIAYWKWVATGQSLLAQRELLRNAQARVRQIEEKVKAEDLPRIARINNDQLIAARETKVIEAERKVQEAAIKMSLFFRDASGQPIVASESQLPNGFPGSRPRAGEEVETDIALAIAASPVLNELDLLAAEVQVDLRNADNMLLPKLDAQLLASKDVGERASPKGDKVPFELEVGLYGEVPLQRREARGKIRSAEGKLSQIAAKRRFVEDKIGAAVRDAVSALRAAADRILRAETNVGLARETLRLGRIQFEEGDIDLVTLNIYEKAVTDAELLLISAQADYFSAIADYRTTLAQPPLPFD